MKSTFTRLVCRVLAASIIALPWQAQAGLVGTDQALAGAQQDARAAVARVLSRGDVVAELQLLGLSAQAASERVAALSDAEVAALAGKIDALPAGGIAHALPIIVVALLIYYLIIVPSMTEKPAPKSPGKAPAAKPKPPAPETK